MNRITKNLIYSLVFIFLFSFSNFFYNSNCKKSSFFQVINSIKSFGFIEYSSCYSLFNLNQNMIKLISKNDYLFNLALDFKKFIRGESIRKDTWFSAFNKSDLEYVSISNNKDKNLTKPFIKGLTSPIVNQTEFINEVDNNDDEYNSWKRSHGGNKNTHYDSNDYINKDNIDNLNLVSVYDSLEGKNINKNWRQHIELNPIFLDNKLVFVTADWKIVCLNPLTGKVIWEKQSIHAPSRRGILGEHDKENDSFFLYLPIGSRLYKIDLKNGNKVKTFGNSGWIQIRSITAPMIYGENLVVATTQSISAFNKFTGKKITNIALHPKRNFLGGSGSAWGGVGIDDKKGIVYIVTGNPRPGSYGVKRKGANKNTNSVIAIDLNKKNIIWSFQETSHDLWDYDISSPPIIYDLNIDNKIYETVIVVTKTGNTLILDRNNGRPIYDIHYREAPQSKLSGEYTSKFQIDLKVPEKFSKIDFSLEDLSNLSKKERNDASRVINNSIYGWYEPPQFGKNLILFGLHGGAQWMGAALDPEKQNLYIPANMDPWIIRPEIISRETNTKFPKEFKDTLKNYIQKCSSCHGKIRNGKNVEYKNPSFDYVPSLVGLSTYPELRYKMQNLDKFNKKHQDLKITKKEFNQFKELFKWWDTELYNDNNFFIEADAVSWTRFLTKDRKSATNPPWGYIAKLNLVSGKIEWKSPVGKTNYKGKDQLVGTEIFGGVALNKGGIIFTTGTSDKLAYALDAENGRVLWTYQMDAAGSAPPILFNIKGKQYVSFLSTGRKALTYNAKEKASKIYTFSVE